MFAIIKTGGKQYKVAEGDILNVEKLGQAEGEIIFEEVLLIANDKNIKIGTPRVNGASVTAKVVSEGKDKKKMIFRYKSKTRQHKKKGHRQPFTQVEIIKILS